MEETEEELNLDTATAQKIKKHNFKFNKDEA